MTVRNKLQSIIALFLCVCLLVPSIFVNAEGTPIEEDKIYTYEIALKSEDETEDINNTEDTDVVESKDIEEEKDSYEYNISLETEEKDLQYKISYIDELKKLEDDKAIYEPVLGFDFDLKTTKDAKVSIQAKDIDKELKDLVLVHIKKDKSIEEIEYKLNKNEVIFSHNDFSPYIFATKIEKQKDDAVIEDSTEETTEPEIVEPEITEEVVEETTEEVEYIDEIPNDVPADSEITEATPLAAKFRAPLRAPSGSNDTQIEIRQLSTQVFYGGKWQSGKYVWDANTNAAGHRFAFRINYALGGVGELPANTVKFTIPKQILKDRTGTLADKYEMSIPSKKDIDSGEDIDNDINYAYYEEGNNIIIYNFREVPAGDNGYIEVAYYTSKTTMNYKDMGKSNDFTTTLTVNHNGQTDTKSAAPIPVYINTNVVITSTSKQQPTKYTTWQSSWGTKPSDADNYFYEVWPVRSLINEKATQPYNFSLVDTLTQTNKWPGELVGYKFSGQSQFSTNNTIANQTLTGYRYDYVLTRHPKSFYDPLEHWEIYNTVKATVDPIDQLDADTTANGSAKVVWNKPVFTIPTGRFNSFKYADGSYRARRSFNIGYNNLNNKYGEYSRYDLDEFQDGTLTKLDNLDYGVWMVGYPYPWTYQGSDPKNPNNYGKLPVKFEMIDEDFYLFDEATGVNTNTKLNNSDFQIDTLSYSIKNQHVTGFNEETQSYILGSNIFDNDDLLTFYAKFNNNDFVKIATYKPLDGTTWFDSNYVKSMTGSKIELKDNCVGYKVETTNKHYYTAVNVHPNITLKNSAKVMNIAGGAQSIGVYNVQSANFYRNDGSLIVSTGEADSDYIRVTQKDSYIFKDVVAATNNVKKKNFAITWKIGMTEQYIAGQGDLNYIDQDYGVFYDLLPAGAVLDLSSVAVRAGTDSKSSNPSGTAAGMRSRTGEFLPDTAYTVEQIPNYKEGRTLLIVRIKDSAKYYDVFFDTIHAWDSIKDFGNDVYNPVAYETGNDKIKYGTNNDGGNLDEKELMKNLPSSATGEKFIYAQNYYDILVLTSASTGLTKKVKALDDKDYSYDTWTTNDGDYEYRWRLASSFTTTTKDIVFFDSLENYIVDGYESDWQGTLTGIDTSQLTQRGVDYKIYYSTIEKLDLEENHDITNNSVWKPLTNSTDLSTVKALAIDCRKTTAGEDFILEEGGSINVILHMVAPHGAESHGTYPETYNNIYVEDTVIGVNGNEEHFFIHQDYTTVRFIVTEDLYLNKVSAEDNDVTIPNIKFRLKGTSDYGTDVDEIVATDSKGQIVFKDIEKGRYILSEYETNPDWLLDASEFTVTVTSECEIEITGQDNANYVSFKNNEGQYTITIQDNPRVHGNLPLLKRREGDSADDLEVKLMLADAEVGDEVEYQGTTYVVTEKNGNRVHLELPVDTKYAVQIYGIGEDTLKDGSTAGLTFGPALGADYLNTYKSHTPTGNTTSGNAHRCIHNDSWETIVSWNTTDPAVYEQCVKEGCTHSVDLRLSDTLKNPDFVYGGTGDGVGALYNELKNGSWDNVYWNGANTNANGWGASRIRAMLNGVDSLTNVSNATGSYSSVNKYTKEEALISAFPAILQGAIGEKVVKYDSVYNNKTAANLKTSYDKLWLPSTAELNLGSSVDEYYQHPLEGLAYSKFVENSQSLTTSSNSFYRAYRQGGNTATSGATYRWWLRSSLSHSSNDVCCVSGNGIVYSISACGRSGVAPCFSLKRAQPDTISSLKGRASLADLWVDASIKPQSPIADTSFKLYGTSEYGNEITKILTTDSLGKLEFTDIELGTYTLEEIIENEDYILNTTKWAVKIDEQGNASIIEPEKEEDRDRLYEVGSNDTGLISVIYNEPRYWNFTLRKVDASNSTIWLEGAEFTLTGISELGTSYKEVELSNENGRVEFSHIEKGTYLLRETKAPTGVDDTGKLGGNRNYLPDTNDYIVKINEKGEVTIDGLSVNEYGDFVVRNDRALDGKITIVKKWVDNETDNTNRPEPTVTISTGEHTLIRGITITKNWEGDTATDRPAASDVVVKLDKKLVTTKPDGSTTEAWVNIGTSTGNWVAGTSSWTYKFDVIYDSSQEYRVYETSETIETSTGTYTAVNTSSNPATVTNAQGSIKNTFTKKPVIKYAVSVYGIGQDTLKEGTAGLTFGPAIGENYVNSYKSHTPTGNTTNGNTHRCIHNDDWATIIQWNSTDPAVYEQCVKEGCTHAVELDGSNNLFNQKFEPTYTGDGPSVLRYELYDETDTTKKWQNLAWNPINNGGSYGTNKDGWGASRIRAMMNGADSLTMTKGSYSYYSSLPDINPVENYTGTNTLLSAFPAELQAAIGEKAVLYDSVYNSKIAANLKTSYDKLWLLSPNEMADSINSSYYNHPLEASTKYQRFTENSLNLSTSNNNKFSGYYVNKNTGGNAGATYYWWLRSSNSGSSYSVCYVNSSGGVGIYSACSHSGVAP